MNDENDSSPRAHSPNDQVKCLLCHSVPDQYISLDCKDDFCLVCLAEKYHEMKQCNEISVNEYNNYEIYCPACRAPTLLDEASINALEETLALMKNETKRNDLFNEIIMEDSAENYINDEGFKIEEKKSFEAKYYNGKNFITKSSLEEKEERKEKDFQIFEKHEFFNEKNFQKKAYSNDHKKLQEFITKPSKKSSPHESNSYPPQENEKRENKKKSALNYDFPSEAHKSKSVEPRCSKHKNEITNLFCFTCETSCMCVECLVEGVHRNHNVKNISKGSDLLNEKLKAINTKLIQKSYENNEILMRLEKEKKTTKNFLQENMEIIHVKFEEIRALINRKEEKILKDFTKKAQERNSKINQQIQEIQADKELYIGVEPPISFDKMSTTAQITYYNNYSENVRKISKLFEDNIAYNSEKKYPELKNPLESKALATLFKTIDALPNELLCSKQTIPTEKINLNNYAQKLRMESEYVQELPTALDSNQNILTQSSSFVSTIDMFKIPQKRTAKTIRNPFKNLILDSQALKLKETIKGSEDLFRKSSKGWNKTPTHSTEAYLELQQRKFEKQKEFFFSNFK